MLQASSRAPARPSGARLSLRQPYGHHRGERRRTGGRGGAARTEAAASAAAAAPAVGAGSASGSVV